MHGTKATFVQTDTSTRNIYYPGFRVTPSQYGAIMSKFCHLLGI